MLKLVVPNNKVQHHVALVVTHEYDYIFPMSLECETDRSPWYLSRQERTGGMIPLPATAI